MKGVMGNILFFLIPRSWNTDAIDFPATLETDALGQKPADAIDPKHQYLTTQE